MSSRMRVRALTQWGAALVNPAVAGTWQQPAMAAAAAAAAVGRARVPACRALSSSSPAAPAPTGMVDRGPAAAPERPAPAQEKKPRVKRARKAVMEVTDRAKQRLAEIIAGKDPAPVGIRLGVRTRGCNGLSYTMNYVDEAPKLDDVVEAGENVKVFVDPKAVMYLVGSSMDFVEDAVRAEFVFQNPNAKGACGCGESFNV